MPRREAFARRERNAEPTTQPGEEIMAIQNYPWTREIPATLIRRLGEAADGCRGTPGAYYLASLAPDKYGNHKIFGPYPTTTADSLPRDASKGEWGWFGPVRTPAYSPTYTIETIDIGTSKPGGTVNLMGPDFDCLFYSLSAVEKFAVPYYARMFGGDYVTRLLAAFRSSNLHLMGHLPRSEYQKLGVDASSDAALSFPGIAAVIRIETAANGEDDVVVEPILPWDEDGVGPQQDQRDGRKRKSGSLAR
jgi:hypothetical protein